MSFKNQTGALMLLCPTGLDKGTIQSYYLTAYKQAVKDKNGIITSIPHGTFAEWFANAKVIKMSGSSDIEYADPAFDDVHADFPVKLYTSARIFGGSYEFNPTKFPYPINLWNNFLSSYEMHLESEPVRPFTYLDEDGVGPSIPFIGSFFIHNDQFFWFYPAINSLDAYTTTLAITKSEITITVVDKSAGDPVVTTVVNYKIIETYY